MGIVVAVGLIVCGLVSMVTKRSLHGVLIGVYLVLVGSTLMVVCSVSPGGVGEIAQSRVLLILLWVCAQMGVGTALVIRSFRVSKNVGVESLTTMRH